MAETAGLGPGEESLDSVEQDEPATRFQERSRGHAYHSPYFRGSILEMPFKILQREVNKILEVKRLF